MPMIAHGALIRLGRVCRNKRSSSGFKDPLHTREFSLEVILEDVLIRLG
jgi:hypothetical protein